MPNNVNEELWNKAVEAFKESYNKPPETDKDWKLVMDIYKNMGGEVSKKSNTFTYTMKFEPYEVIQKKEKKYIIEGYVSTIDEDLSSETVTMSAQRDIYNQIKERIDNATVTGDEEHEIYTSADGYFEDSIPKLKFIDAELTDKGVWVKAEVNKYHPNFESVWGSIKEKYLNSFSITFIPTEAIKKRIGDTWKSFINKLNLLNITLTGNPMNPNATFNPVMKSAINNYQDSFNTSKKTNTNSNKGDTMSELDKKTNEEINEKTEKVKAKSEEEKDEAKESSQEAGKESSKEESSKETNEESKVEAKSNDDKAYLKKELEEIKAELKALKEKPIFKAKVEDPKLNKKDMQEKKDFNAFNYIK